MYRTVRGKYGTRAYCPACRHTVPDTANDKSDHLAVAHGLGNGIRGWVHAQQAAIAQARERRARALATTATTERESQ